MKNNIKSLILGTTIGISTCLSQADITSDWMNAIEEGNLEAIQTLLNEDSIKDIDLYAWKKILGKLDSMSEENLEKLIDWLGEMLDLKFLYDIMKLIDSEDGDFKFYKEFYDATIKKESSDKIKEATKEGYMRYCQASKELLFWFLLCEKLNTKFWEEIDLGYVFENKVIFSKIFQMIPQEKIVDVTKRIVDEGKKWNLLHFVLTNGPMYSYDLLSKLGKCNISKIKEIINATDNQDRTPIFLAIEKGYMFFVHMCFGQIKDVDIFTVGDKDGKNTPLALLQTIAENAEHPKNTYAKKLLKKIAKQKDTK